MKVLVDTPIWIDHLQRGDATLRRLLLADAVCIATPVLGELSAGNLPDRQREYDRETYTLSITLREARVKERNEIRPGVIADFDYDDGIVGFEVLNASSVVEQTKELQFAVAN